MTDHRRLHEQHRALSRGRVCLPRAVACLGIWLGAALSSGGCESSGVEPTGGETHFLKSCVPAESCGQGLICLCGACTLVCDSEDTCAGFPEARCATLAADDCEGNVALRACEVQCQSDVACAELSREHRCVEGRCRMADGSTTTDGEGGATSAAETEGDTAGCGEMHVLANEVVLLGDSFLAESHQITGYLEDLARTAGALRVGERYRDYSRLTMNALALNGEGIRAQYEAAQAEAPARIVIMNGGGADVLLGSCDPLGSDCPLVQTAVAALRELLSTMAEDHVSAVVYVGYPDPQPPRPDAVRDKMALLRPLLEQACAEAPLPCSWVDLRPVFADYYADYLLADGLNPTAAGSAQSAVAIWDVMRAACIAQ